MKSVRIHSFGGPDVLAFDELPLPTPGEGEVLIKVHAASVNPVDWKIRDGSYPAASEDKLPMPLGRDVSGIVAAVGPGMEDVRSGDAVMAFLGRDRGGYSEFVLARREEIAPKPRSLSHTEAAAVPLAAMTASQGLFRHGGLEPSQHVLIHGGAGGVGHFAIQLAKARGAWVATTVSARDVDFAHACGADKVIDYKATRFEDEVEPVDVVFDLISGETRQRSFSVLKPGGVLVSTLGTPDEDEASRRGVRVAGYMAEPDAAELAEIGRLIDEGKVRVAVQATYPFSQAAKAQDDQENGHSQGKVVLELVA